MDRDELDGDDLLRLAHEQEGEFFPLCLIGFVIEGKSAGFRIVGDERRLRLLLTYPAGRQWFHDAVDRFCDGTKPPDDWPQGLTIKRFMLE